MEPFKTTGLVLRTSAPSESSQVLTVLTPDRGKISIWARGIKSTKNPMRAGCAVLCYSEFILLPRPGMYSLTGCTLLQSFYHLREDIEKLSYAAYFAELSALVTKEGIEAEAPLRLLLNTLHYLEHNKKTAADLKILYELRLLSAVGFMPCTIGCIHCGNPKAYILSPKSGGLVCSACGEGRPLSPPAAHVLHAYTCGPLKAALDFNGQSFVSELAAPVEAFMRYHLDAQPKSLAYLNRMQNIFNKNAE